MSTSNVLATVLSISYCLFNPESLNYHHSIGMETSVKSCKTRRLMLEAASFSPARSDHFLMWV